MGNTWNSIRMIGEVQHGLITRRQLGELGIADGQIRSFERRGVLVRIGWGVYGLPGAVPTVDRRVMAACLEAGPLAAASHGTAMYLWGLWNEEPRRIDVVRRGGPGRRSPSRPAGSDRQSRDVRLHRTEKLDPLDFASVRNIPVTTVARTLVDLTAMLEVKVLSRLVDEADRRGLLDHVDLARCADGIGNGRWRHRRKLAPVLAARASRGPGASPPEVDVLGWIVSAGLPVPEQNVRIKVGGVLDELDLAYPELRIDIEYDGWNPHRTRERFDADRARDRRMAAADWDVLRVTSATRRAAFIDELTAVHSQRLDRCRAA